MQIGARSAGAASPAAGLLAPADAVRVGGRQIVQILTVFEPDLQPSFERGSSDCRSVGGRREERSFLAADLAALACPAFRLAEIRQALVPCPATIAERPPMVVVLGLAADVDQPVDRRGAAYHPAA